MKVMRSFHKKSRSTILLLLLVTLSLCVNLVVLNGCKVSRDSGSTVTGRGVRFPSGDGIPLMRVLLNGPEDTRFRATDSQGEYTMLHVPTGSYDVTFARFGYTIYSEQLVVDKDEETYVLNLPQLTGGVESLTGTITDPFGGQINGAEVWLLYDNGGLAYGQSAVGGNFAIDNLPDGNVNIIASADGFETAVYEEERIGFEGLRYLDVILEPVPDFVPGIVSGLVRNEDGEILSDAYIGVFLPGQVPGILTPAVTEVLTSQSGYLIDNLPEGTYTLLCLKSGYLLESELLLIEEGQSSTVDFELEPE